MGRFNRAAQRHLMVMTAIGAVVMAGAVSSQPSQPSQVGTTPQSTRLSTVSQSTTGSTMPRATAVSARPSKVLVVVLENHGLAAAMRQMPNLAAHARGYARASGYYATTHPSLPNYLVMAGGSTFGVKNNTGPAYHRLPGSSVFGQVIARGKTAKTYAEGMTSNCLRVNTGRYAVRHNPWTYFASSAERSKCLKYNVPAGTTRSGALHRDIAAGRLPTFSMLVPDLCHDAHDCSLRTADVWLKAWLSQIKAGPDFRAGRLAVVVTFDEDDRVSGNRVLTVVIHPSRRGVVVTRRLNHYSLSATPSRMVGATALRRAAGTPNFLAAFGLR